MSEETAEGFYDREIAPALLELGRKCEERGLSFLAFVEFGPNETGTTLTKRPGSGIEFNLTAMAARARGNVDSLFLALRRYAADHGHNSAVLAMQGVPARKEAEDG